MVKKLKMINGGKIAYSMLYAKYPQSSILLMLNDLNCKFQPIQVPPYIEARASVSGTKFHKSWNGMNIQYI